MIQHDNFWDSNRGRRFPAPTDAFTGQYAFFSVTMRI
jgi:hypothetical protein